MPETISDTGPVLHLHEIGCLETLATVAPLVFPLKVWEERAYAAGRISRAGLERSIEALLEESTLHLSRAFRSYVRKLLAELP